MQFSSLLSSIKARQLGQLSDTAKTLTYTRLQSLNLSQRKSINSETDGNVNWLSLDAVESRYLLAAASDSSIAAYDVAGISQAQEKPLRLFKIDRSHPDAHKFSVSCAVWYPVDTGLFVTGSFDRTVKVWDTNVQQVACLFDNPAQVNGLAMSNCAAGHCLISVASNADVRLCDPNSGSTSQTLTGHKDKTWCVAWSLHSEWELMTGACDGQVMLWDIRAPGCVRVLNQYDTETAERPSSLRSRGPGRARHSTKNLPQSTAHEGSVTAILPIPGALYWVTAGTDSRIRLWDSSSFKNKLVNYPLSFNRAIKGRQLAIAGSADLLFHPSGSAIQGFHLFTGKLEFTLKGHMDSVNACCYNETMQELYTGSNDHQLHVWVPSRDSCIDKDTWSE